VGYYIHFEIAVLVLVIGIMVVGFVVREMVGKS